MIKISGKSAEFLNPRILVTLAKIAMIKIVVIPIIFADNGPANYSLWQLCRMGR